MQIESVGARKFEPNANETVYRTQRSRYVRLGLCICIRAARTTPYEYRVLSRWRFRSLCVCEAVYARGAAERDRDSRNDKRRLVIATERREPFRKPRSFQLSCPGEKPRSCRCFDGKFHYARGRADCGTVPFLCFRKLKLSDTRRSSSYSVCKSCTTTRIKMEQPNVQSANELK